MKPKTYTIKAYNFSTNMIEVLPLSLSKTRAVIVSEEMKRLGAKKVKIVPNND